MRLFVCPLREIALKEYGTLYIVRYEPSVFEMSYMPTPDETENRRSAHIAGQCRVVQLSGYA